MSDSNVTPMPERVDLDLDALEKDPKETRDPFRPKINGRVVTMTDPEDADWADVAAVANPHEFLRICMSADDREYLYDQALPGWKMGKLMDGFYRHFGIEERVARARRDSLRLQS